MHICFHTMVFQINYFESLLVVPIQPYVPPFQPTPPYPGGISVYPPGPVYPAVPPPFGIAHQPLVNVPYPSPGYSPSPFLSKFRNIAQQFVYIRYLYDIIIMYWLYCSP